MGQSVGVHVGIAVGTSVGDGVSVGVGGITAASIVKIGGLSVALIL